MMHWSLPIPLEAEIAIHKCQECGQRGHVEKDCPKWAAIRIVLAQADIREEKQQKVLYWFGAGLMFLAGVVLGRML